MVPIQIFENTKFASLGVEESSQTEKVGVVCFGGDTRVISRCCLNYYMLRQEISKDHRIIIFCRLSLVVMGHWYNMHYIIITCFMGFFQFVCNILLLCLKD